MSDLERRVARLEQAADATQPPAAVPVLLGTLGETEAAIRDRHGIDPDTRAVVVTVTDARRDGPRRETN